MKKKTINKIITAKIKDWVWTIDDPIVVQAIQRDVVVTGGCIASMLLKEKVNDFDIYFKTIGTTKKVVDYYIQEFKENPPPAFKNADRKVKISYEVPESKDRVKIVVKSAGVAGEESSENPYAYFESVPVENGQQDNYVDGAFEQIARNDEAIDENPTEMVHAASADKPPYRPVFLSTNAITLSNRVQIITRFIGTPDEIHKYYDYVHCTNYWTPKEGVVLRQDALEAILARELRYVGSKYPLCSIIRSKKFIKRDWTINAGQYVKMAMQLNELDLLDVNVLEDQLTGVDVAYFIQVIAAIREKKDIDTAYVIAVVDKMFQ